MSKHLDNLDPVSKKRYLQKISILGDNDPYLIPSQNWSTEDYNNYPPVTYPDVFTYLVCKTSHYTSESFKAYKSLTAYNQAYNGWVRVVKVCKPSGSQLTVVKAEVLHSQKLNEPPLQPWASVQPDGTIEDGHCTCMAGLGETCTHVASMLFYIEAANRIREYETVTGQPAYWKPPPGLKRVVPMRASEIDFTSSSSQRKCLLSGKAVKRPRQRNANTSILTDDQRRQLLVNINSISTSTKPVILSVLPGFSDSFKPRKNDLPKSLHLLRDDNFNGCTYDMLLRHCSNITLSISKHQIDSVESQTRDQSSSKLWRTMREGRITASVLHSVCHTNVDKPSLSLLHSIVSGPTVTTKAIEWGKEQEERARLKYVSQISCAHANFECFASGLFISQSHPFIAGSPDGIISCSCCGKGCLEIKCPFSAKDMTILEAASSLKNFCLSLSDHEQKPFLKQSHQYFYQIQCQMFVTSLEYADFCVWTEKDVFIDRVEFDEAFMMERLERASLFFTKVIMPELVGNFFSTKPMSPSRPQMKQVNNIDASTSNSIYCLCQKEEHGKMILCDNDGCSIGWFHYGCVGLKSSPRGKWFCPDCKPCKKRKKL